MRKIVVKVDDSIPERLDRLLKSGIWGPKYKTRDAFLRDIISKAILLDEARAKDQGLIKE